MDSNIARGQLSVHSKILVAMNESRHFKDLEALKSNISELERAKEELEDRVEDLEEKLRDAKADLEEREQRQEEEAHQRVASDSAREEKMTIEAENFAGKALFGYIGFNLLTFGLSPFWNTLREDFFLALVGGSILLGGFYWGARSIAYAYKRDDSTMFSTLIGVIFFVLPILVVLKQYDGVL